MRLLVLLLSIAMPVVAWLSQSGRFGPDNGAISDQYPTLLVAAGYAFAIWGLIFLLDLGYGIWQASGTRRNDPTLQQIAPWTAGGFALTAAWMPLFSHGLFWLCLLVIFAALYCLARAAILLSRDPQQLHGQWLWAWTPISLHAGWLTLAAFLDLAQVIVAYHLLPGGHMLGWSLALLVLVAVTLLALNQRMRGNIDYVIAAVWGLIAVYVKQSGWDLPGANIAAILALVIAVVLIMQTVLLRRRAHDGWVPGH